MDDRWPEHTIGGRNTIHLRVRRLVSVRRVPVGVATFPHHQLLVGRSVRSDLHDGGGKGNVLPTFRGGAFLARPGQDGMRFHTVVEVGGKTATGREVPDHIVTALERSTPGQQGCCRVAVDGLPLARQGDTFVASWPSHE